VECPIDTYLVAEKRNPRGQPKKTQISTRQTDSPPLACAPLGGGSKEKKGNSHKQTKKKRKQHASAQPHENHT
jgi:hypothetical protein